MIVVLGAAAENIRAGAHRDAVFVYNTDYRSGQTSSLQSGLRAVPADADGVLFTLVDHPAVAAKTIDALLDTSAPADPHAALRGPPRPSRLVSRATSSPNFWRCRATGAANQVVRAHRAQTEFLDVDDPGIVADIDDPAAYQELLASSIRGRV